MIAAGADRAGSGPRSDERGRRGEPGQKRSSRLEIDGWINLNKPTAVSSTQAVGRLKFLFNARKAGHAGTLDPLASGVLPVAFGEATVQALNRHKKELRGLVAHRVNLRFAPDLRFALDASFDAQARIDALLKSPEVARDLGAHEIEKTDET